MAEVTYTIGRDMIAHLGKGKALLGLNVTSGTNSDTITTPFKRCVSVITPSVACDNTSVTNVTEAAGVITIAGAGTQITEYQVLILGEMY